MKSLVRRALFFKVLIVVWVLYIAYDQIRPLRDWLGDFAWFKFDVSLAGAFFRPYLEFKGWPIFVARAGIGLDFLAGFLVAPELLGVQRIVDFEKWLKGRLQRVERWWYRRARLGGDESPMDIISTALFMAWIGLFFQYDSIFGDDRWQSWIVVGVTYLYGAARGASEARGGFGWKSLGVIKGMLLMFVFLTLSWVVIPWILLCLFFLKLTNLFVEALEGNERLKSYMVVTGITFFIAGKAMAFFATFL